MTTEFGFEFGAAKVERFCQEKDGRVVIGLTTPKERMHIHVTKTGQVRIYSSPAKLADPTPNQVEWKAQQGGAN
jgi:hypothetical protein